MRSLKILILFLCLVTSSFGFASGKALGNEKVVQNHFPNVFRPIGRIVKKILGIKPKIIYCPPSASVTSVELSQTEIVFACSNGVSCQENVSSINVSTIADDPENDVLTYVYAVSGGEIVGKGANVVWNLSGVKPGTYTITAGVDDGAGVIGKTLTKIVEVVKCLGCE